ncbi:3'-5' exonuclease [Pseudoalteromonas citrea]|nr:3'-5' exonuclease [Pseudoalteromonas citrea]
MMGVCKWLHTQWISWQLKQSYFDQHEYVIVDLELTGLEPKKHEIVSAGWVTMQSFKIDLNTAGYMLNSDVNSLLQSPIYHGVDNTQLTAQGAPLSTLVDAFAEALNDRILVCHNAQLDWAFIQHAASAEQKVIQPKAIVDTLKIEKHRLLVQGKQLKQSDLTLAACRERYALPAHHEHNALSDALATAELLLAQYHTMYMGNREKLSAIM